MEEGEKSRGENGEGSSWSGSDNDSDSGSPPVARPAPVHFVCGACVKLFPSKADLDSHMKEAHESSPCPLCAKTVKSAYLTRHIKDYHSGAPKAKAFRCPLKPCDKAYTSVRHWAWRGKGSGLLIRVVWDLGCMGTWALLHTKLGFHYCTVLYGTVLYCTILNKMLGSAV